MVKDKKIHLNNPLSFCNFQTESLENAKDDLLGILRELAADMSEEEIIEIAKIIEFVYLKKRASYLIEGKFNGLLKYLSESYDFALKSNKRVTNNDYTELTYFNHTKKLLANEQY